MKKVLICETLAFSINAFAQNNKPALNLEQTIINTLEKVHGILDNEEWKTSGSIIGMNFIKTNYVIEKFTSKIIIQ